MASAVTYRNSGLMQNLSESRPRGLTHLDSVNLVYYSATESKEMKQPPFMPSLKREGGRHHGRNSGIGLATAQPVRR